MATEPRYIYDPVTQTYTRVDDLPAPVAELDPLYRLRETDSGNAGSAPAGGRSIGQGISPTAQSIGLTGLGYSKAFGGFLPGATLVGLASNAVLDSQIDAMAEAQANLGAMDASQGRGMGIATVADPVGNTFSMASPATVDAVDMDTFGITGAGLAGLAAMNAQQAQENQAQQNQAANVAAAADAAAQGVSVSEAADAAQDAANAADAAAAASTSGGDSSVGGGDAGSGSEGTAGAGDEGSHGADGNNSGSDSSDSGGGGGEGEKEGGIIRMKKYAQGGVADAYKTQARGRGPDTMLVHMSPKEVQGLQALAMAHGGSLTINPKTGLPEAGFLDAILPMVAGAALTGISGGLINPMTAGLIVGGGTALMSGDLGKGFMAGLGAFGGAGLGAGLAGAGASTTAGQVITPATANATQVAAQPVVSSATSSIAPESFRGFLTSQGTLAPQVVSPAMNQAIAQQATNTAVQQAAAAPTFSGMTQGIQNLATGQPGAGANFMTAVGGTSGALKYGGAAAAPLLAGGFSEDGEALPTKTQYIRPYKYDAGRQMDRQGFQYRTGAPGESSSELTYFNPTFTAQPVQTYKDYMSRNMAAGGIASMAKGRYLKGAGDGMSDDIPATIEGGQPARLADGEFVVPADVVSHLGNGSSNAGAKKLYKMMDRVRQARTGKKSQAPEVKTDRLIPA